jgi:membrane protein YqaA with SNARE-associated domain
MLELLVLMSVGLISAMIGGMVGYRIGLIRSEQTIRDLRTQLDLSQERAEKRSQNGHLN